GVALKLESGLGPAEPQELADPSLVPAEIQRFDRAVAETAAELAGIVQKVTQQYGTAEAAIFKSHLSIAKDEPLRAKVRALIESEKLTALSALQVVLQDYAAQFAAIEHELFRERITDIRDVISRIGSHLAIHEPPAPAADESGENNGDPIILVA